MAVLKSTLVLLLAVSSQALALPTNRTEPIKPVPCELPTHSHRDRSSFAELAPTKGPIYNHRVHSSFAGLAPPKRPIHNHRVHSSFAEVASTELAPTKLPTHSHRNRSSCAELTKSTPTKRPIVDHPAHHPPAELATTESATKTYPLVDHPAHHTPAEMAHTKSALTKRSDPAETTLDEPSPTIPLASTTLPDTAAFSPSSPPSYLATPTAPPSGLDLSPDLKDMYMIGQPTFLCTYRFQLSGRKDHYFLTGRNWNITGEQLEDAVKKVVYNAAEWGASHAGGADKDGNYLPGGRAKEDTISFKYSDTYVPDAINPGGIQEFAAEVSCLAFFPFDLNKTND
jgi:hypothetical protein